MYCTDCRPGEEFMLSDLAKQWALQNLQPRQTMFMYCSEWEKRYSSDIGTSALTVALLLQGIYMILFGCKKLSGGVLAWLSVCGEVPICIWPSWCHCHSLSCSSKSRLVLPFWYQLTQVVPDKGPLNRLCCCYLAENRLRLFTVNKSFINSSVCFVHNSRPYWGCK